MNAARDVIANAVHEAQLMANITELALRLGYLVAHVPDALYAHAAVSGRHDAMAGAKGLPDLLIVGHGRFLVIECKAQRGSVTPEQQQWIAELLDAGVPVHVVRPDDWLNGAVDAVLAVGE